MKDENKKQNKETSTSANQIKKSGTNYKDLSEGFKLIIENTADIIFQVTLTGKITYISPSCERIADYKPEEMIGKSFTKFVPKKELPRYFSKIKEMISGKKIDSFETYVFHKDGHLMPVEFSGQIVKIKNKSFINGVLRDITERKHVEKDLQESESQLKKFVENSPIGIYRTTPDGKITMANPALVHMLGYSSFEELSKCDLENTLYHPAYPRKQFKKRIEKDKKIIGLESTWTKKDGSTLFIRENALAIYDADGGICCYEGTVENLTKQKEIEESLRKSEENYRTLVENQTDIVFKINRDMKFLYINPPYCNIFGKKEKDLLGKNYLSFIHEGDREKTQKAFDKICKPPYTCYVEHRTMAKDGWRWIASSNKSILDSDNNVAGIIGIGRDITKQKKAEIELFRTKEFLQNVIDSATEFILTFDVNAKISFWNKSAERITGFKAQQIIGRQPTMLEVFDNPKELEDYLNKVLEGEMPTFDDLLLKTKGGRKKLIKTTNSIMRNEGEQPIGILFIGKDISRESETHRKLLPGTSYLIINENIEPALDLFTDLTISNYDGLFITRDSLNKMQSIFPSIDIDIVEL
ncbi:MAG: PAS domain-containing protein, partial [Candidatus Thermoplasmatota archaeon]|nr:PAS domain-containing protein [Candidatus Thermoplasmatota archaeon]